MSASLDLFILPVVRQSGVDHSDLPGVYAAQPPRRAARGREADRLILYLTLTGLSVRADQYQSLLERLAETYFKTPGTATAAMRAVAEALNETLLERNQRSAGSGQQSLGLLIQAVLRSDMIYLAHSGPVHTFLLSGSSPQHLSDPTGSGRGLGIGRQVPVRYYHCTLQGGQYALLSHQSSPSWETESMLAAPNQEFETLRRKLVAVPDQELSALLIQAQAGSGKLNLMRLKPPSAGMVSPGQTVAAHETPKPASQPTAARAENTSDFKSSPPARPAHSPAPLAPRPVEAKPADQTTTSRSGQTPPPLHPAAAPVPTPALPVEQPVASPATSRDAMASRDAASTQAVTPTQAREPGLAGQPGQGQPSQPAAVPPPAKPAASESKPAASKPAKSSPGQPNPLQKAGAAVYLALRTFGQAVRLTFRKAGGGVLELLRRVMPDESMLDFSPSTMLFLALIIPLLIGVAGTMMYIERGQRTQYETLYQQAVEQARAANDQTDITSRRSAWKKVMETIDSAENYMVTAESQDLRTQASNTLDQLDGVTRLDFRPAILSGLDKNVSISRLAVFDGDLYILDSASGRVLRAIAVGGGYQLDPAFNCGPTASAIYIDDIIDISALPRYTEAYATLMAMDRNGNVLECIPGGDPIVQQIVPGNTNFGTPRAFNLNNNNLYLLNYSSNMVWIYPDLNFTSEPHFYFGDQIPRYMDTMIDLTVDGDRLYLLRSNGQIARCTYSDIPAIPTRCEDPYPFTDRVPDQQTSPNFRSVSFNKIFLAPPPEPALFLLDPEGQAVYRFGLQLSYDTQYRSIQPLPKGKASAFTVSKDRQVFMAIGNEIFYAHLP